MEVETKIQIVKATSGSLRWQIRKNDKMIVRCATKKLATLYLRLFNGDISAAPAWYRLLLGYARKRMGASDALRFAVGSARQYGIGPTSVQADPETGLPLEECAQNSQF